MNASSALVIVIVIAVILTTTTGGHLLVTIAAMAVILLIAVKNRAIDVKRQSLRVIDGDSIDIAHGARRRRCRIVGYDAPEHDQPGGRAAKMALASLLRRAGKITARRRGRDVYGRTLIRLKVDGSDVARAMIAKGHGHPDRSTTLPNRLRAMGARLSGRGSWAHRSVSPRAWRDGRKWR